MYLVVLKSIIYIYLDGCPIAEQIMLIPNNSFYERIHSMTVYLGVFCGLIKKFFQDLHEDSR